MIFTNNTGMLHAQFSFKINGTIFGSVVWAAL